MPTSRTIALGVSAASLLLIAGGAQAQWVTFENVTATHLVLQSVSLTDGEEKDIAVADFNRDGRDDVIIVRKRPFSVAGPRTDVLLMQENGMLVERTSQYAPQLLSNPSDARDVIVRDFDGDGWPDIVIANTFFQQPMYYRNRGNDGNGQWLGFVSEGATRFPYTTPVNQPDGPQFCALDAGDVNGDGHLDIFFSNYRPSGGTSDVLFINDGTGHFTNETAARLGNYANVAFGPAGEIRDVDNDGDMDIIKVSTLYNSAPFNAWGTYVLFNNGAGVFNTRPFQNLWGDSPYMFTMADFNNNGVLDMYAVDDGQDAIVRITNPVVDGPLGISQNTLSGSPRTGGFGGNVKVVDIDNDGDLDVGVSPIDVDIANCGTGSRFALLRNDGAGAFTDPWPNSSNQNIHIEAHDFGFLDINNDGCLDIIMGTCTSYVLFRQTNCLIVGDIDGDGMVGFQDLNLLLGSYGQTGPGLPGDLDGDGDVDFADLNRLLNNYGAGN
ncbi:MAG: VCBS repeat-containing protein [Phycisphaerales bacterium]|nr:VCBS repeat-containing protein [Phycisphaerales bacterium]